VTLGATAPSGFLSLRAAVAGTGLACDDALDDPSLQPFDDLDLEADSSR
jgi:hypothetical protein